MKTNQRSVGVEKGSPPPTAPCAGTCWGTAEITAATVASVPQERGCGPISAIAHELCRSLRAKELPINRRSIRLGKALHETCHRFEKAQNELGLMPAAEKPFLLCPFPDPICRRLYKNDFFYSLAGTGCRFFMGGNHDTRTWTEKTGNAEKYRD